jgi:hypothetical protein
MTFNVDDLCSARDTLDARPGLPTGREHLHSRLQPDVSNTQTSNALRYHRALA